MFFPSNHPRSRRPWWNARCQTAVSLAVNGDRSPIRGILVGGCWAEDPNEATSPPAPSATISLRRLFIPSPDKLRTHYAKSHEGKQFAA
jgi:hypothetical protein